MDKDSGPEPVERASEHLLRWSHAPSLSMQLVHKSPCRKGSVGSNGMPGPLQAQQEVRVCHLGTLYLVTSPHFFREVLGSF